uniref:Ricin B-type lectin domain-containing protein n=1 Tax=Mesocestoides corti TaxID=53468 RepID=A0A5K3FY00_MESCO
MDCYPGHHQHPKVNSVEVLDFSSKSQSCCRSIMPSRSEECVNLLIDDGFVKVPSWIMSTTGHPPFSRMPWSTYFYFGLNDVDEHQCISLVYGNVLNIESLRLNSCTHRPPPPPLREAWLRYLGNRSLSSADGSALEKRPQLYLRRCA